MIVFKNYFKILKANIKTLLLYTIIFLALVVISTRVGSSPSEGYANLKMPIYVKDESNSEVSKAVIDYIKDHHELVDMDEDMVEDKLFYQLIVAAVTIPEDFEDKRILHFEQAPNDSYAVFAKHELNQLLNQIATYEKAGYSTTDAIANSKKDFDKEIEVTIKRSDTSARFINASYFSYLAYVLMSQLILIIATVNLTYSYRDTYKRNLISPYRKKRLDLELILGHIVAGLLLWMFYMVVYMVLFRDFSLEKPTIMAMLNALVFSISIITFAVFISKLIKNGDGIAGIMNVYSLGSSFLTGIFVPMEILGDTAKTIGKIFPAYYYVDNIIAIRTGADTGIIWKNFLIMLGFALAFVVLTLIIRPDITKMNTEKTN